MPILKNIATDLTPEQLIDQVNRHPETRKHLEDIEKIQQSFTKIIEEVLQIIEIPAASADFPLKSLEKPHHLERKSSSDPEETLFQWQAVNNQPLTIDEQELEFLRLIDLLLTAQQRLREEQERNVKDHENNVQQAEESLKALCKKFKEIGLIIENPEDFELQNFSNHIQDQGQKVSKLSRKQWKNDLEKLWKEKEKEIGAQLKALVTTDETPKPFLSPEETQMMRDVFTRVLDPQADTEQLSSQDLEKIKGLVELKLKKPGQSIQQSVAFLDLQRHINEPITVKFAKKRERKVSGEQKNNLPSEAGSLSTSKDSSATPAVPLSKRINRITRIVAGLTLLITGAGVSVDLATSKPQTPPPARETEQQKLENIKARVQKYADFELDEGWHKYCKEKNLDYVTLSLTLTSEMIKAGVHWMDEIGTMGNFAQKKWKVFMTGHISGNIGLDDLILMDEPDTWGSHFINHIRYTLAREFNHDAMAQTLLYNYELYCAPKKENVSSEFIELFPDIKKLPINTDPDILEQERELNLENMALHEAIRNYPVLTPGFIKRLLKKILTSPKENDFLLAHLRDGDAISPGFRRYMENLDFFKNTMNGNMRELNDIGFKNNVAYVVVAKCGQITQNGRTRWRIVPTTNTQILLDENGVVIQDVTFTGCILVNQIPAGTKKIIIKRDGVEVIIRDIPADFQYAPPHVTHGDRATLTSGGGRPSSISEQSPHNIATIGTEIPMWMTQKTLSDPNKTLLESVFELTRGLTDSVQEKYVCLNAQGKIQLFDPNEVGLNPQEYFLRNDISNARPILRFYEFRLKPLRITDDIDVTQKAFEFVTSGKHYFIFKGKRPDSMITGWYIAKIRDNIIEKGYSLINHQPGILTIVELPTITPLLDATAPVDMKNEAEVLPIIVALLYELAGRER